MNVRVSALRLLLAGMVSVSVAGCGNSSSGGGDNGCSVKFDVSAPVKEGTTWTYSAPIGDACTDFFTKETGGTVVHLEIFPNGTFSTPVMVDALLLENQPEALVSLPLETSISKDLRTKWHRPLAATPTSLKLRLQVDPTFTANPMKSATAIIQEGEGE